MFRYVLAVLIGSFAFLGTAAAQDKAGQDKVTVFFGETPILPTHGSVTGTWFFADTAENGQQSQILLLGHDNLQTEPKSDWRLIAQLAPNEAVTIRVPNPGAGTLHSTVTMTPENGAAVTCRQETVDVGEARPDAEGTLALKLADNAVYYRMESKSAEPVTIRMTGLYLEKESGNLFLSLDPVRRPQPGISSEHLAELASLTAENRAKALTNTSGSVDCYPDLAQPLQAELIEWDWRQQDGIGTPNEPRTYMQALKKRLPQVRDQLADLAEVLDESGTDAALAQCAEYQQQVETLTSQFTSLQAADAAVQEATAAKLWHRLHEIRRDAVLMNPLFPQTPILFVKHVPGGMSHQLTQVYGYCARPGGGLFILDQPGISNKARKLETGLPLGNYMHPTLSYDGRTILFAYCETPKMPTLWRDPATMDRYYQIYSMNVDGTGLKQLTTGNFDHFAPVFLPDGDILFSSTRRLIDHEDRGEELTNDDFTVSFHRCGSGPCYVYTLIRMKPDGSGLKPISYHETQEWDPTVASDGRIVYTRWDYVDRNAVTYQQLWSTRPDGTDVRIYYGNNTLSPCGLWESKTVPGSSKIMAVGGPHHGLSAGSVVLIDNTLGVDGPEPITRLTPEVLFPEAETPLPMVPQLPVVYDFDTPPTGYWDANTADRPAFRLGPTEEGNRWPTHCFKSPWPLSEKYFLASYSFDKLIGEAGPNIPNQFGLYWCDAFGTRELLYRDPNISSLWAMPIASRPMPPAYVSTLPEKERDESGNLLPGRFFVQNVYENWPWSMPEGVKIKSLRIVQVLPKTTPNANQPKVGEPNASPGKQILGTVPVAEDGSAYFEVPSKTPFLMQALDERGRMIEGMRSLVYAQPGETQSCTGCHENRLSATMRNQTIASRQEVPSPLTPGPDGSKPFSYPILVQPVLDAKCVSCHNNEKAEGGVNLTGEIEGQYTKSYNALISRVSYSAWGMPDSNHEPMTKPLELGTPASPLIAMLDKGHYDCVLTDEEWERICTWIDGSNALFYGTFNVENQAIQQQGGRIAGPDLE